MNEMSTLESIVYDGVSLRIIDQLLLPHVTVYLDVNTVQDAYDVIKKMQVGA
jgi:methylthioribose-1-phosphate isomerase